MHETRPRKAVWAELVLDHAPKPGNPNSGARGAFSQEPRRCTTTLAGTAIPRRGPDHLGRQDLPDGYVRHWRAPARPVPARRRQPLEPHEPAARPARRWTHARQRPPHRPLHGDRQPPRPAPGVVGARDRTRRPHPVAPGGRPRRHQDPRGPLPGGHDPNRRRVTGVGDPRLPASRTAPGPRRPYRHPHDLVQPARQRP